jgi:hypothetical protein
MPGPTSDPSSTQATEQRAWHERLRDIGLAAALAALLVLLALYCC